jgi:hypothetical protein
MGWNDLDRMEKREEAAANASAGGGLGESFLTNYVRQQSSKTEGCSPQPTQALLAWVKSSKLETLTDVHEYCHERKTSKCPPDKSGILTSHAELVFNFSFVNNIPYHFLHAINVSDGISIF